MSGMGSFSRLTDPEGRMMGLWKVAPQKVIGDWRTAIGIYSTVSGTGRLTTFSELIYLTVRLIN